MGVGEDLCQGLRVALYQEWSRRKKVRSQECKKSALPRNGKISSLVEGAMRDRIR